MVLLGDYFQMQLKRSVRNMICKENKPYLIMDSANTVEPVLSGQGQKFRKWTFNTNLMLTVNFNSLFIVEFRSSFVNSEVRSLFEKLGVNFAMIFATNSWTLRWIQSDVHNESGFVQGHRPCRCEKWTEIDFYAGANWRFKTACGLHNFFKIWNKFR